MERNQALDIAKGIAIILVVAFHTSQGLIAAGRMQDGFALSFAENVAYGVHVQIFFLIAGYLSFPAAMKVDYQISRAASLYYAYLIWSLASVAAAMLLPGGANHGSGLGQMVWIPIRPVYHFWFILALIASTALLYFLRRTLALALAVPIMLACTYFGLDWVQICYFFPFAAVGALLRLHGWTPQTNLPLAGLAGAILIAAAWLATTFDISIKAAYLFPASLAGCYALYAVSDLLVRTRVAVALAYVGSGSLTIYLAHGFFTAAMRAVGSKLLPGQSGLLLWGACVMAGVLGPLVLAWFTGKLGLSQLAGFKPFRVHWPMRR